MFTLSTIRSLTQDGSCSTQACVEMTAVSQAEAFMVGMIIASLSLSLSLSCAVERCIHLVG
jgi:hypothetical protein